MPIPFDRYVDITSSVGGTEVAAQRELILRLITTNPLIPSGTIEEFESAAEVSTYFDGDTSAEFLYVVEGDGILFIGNEEYAYGPDHVLHIPSAQLHGGKTGATKVIGIQVYAPAGPEQRFKTGALTQKK